MDTADEFIAKWRARWPEWGIGAAFLPPPRREAAQAWLTLLQELTDAAWAGTDATPGLAKLAWWNEELQGWAKGARRHPLGARLQPLAAPWSELAATLRALQSVREAAPGDEAGLDAFAGAAARCESALSGDQLPDDEAGTAALLRDLQAERALLHGDAARARELLAAAPARTGGPRLRRLQSAFARQRLRALAAGEPQRPPSPPRSLWLAWRAARGR